MPKKPTIPAPAVDELTEKSVPLKKLRPYERNPRRITKEAYERLKDKLQRLGYHQRIICTRDLRVIGGHQRIRALRELGVDPVNILVPDRDLTEKEFRELLISDNLPFGEFDFDILGADFLPGELMEYGMPEDWLGFMPDLFPGKTDPEDVPEPPTKPVTKLGDIWHLGNHTVMCGDATNFDEVKRLIGDEKIHMVYTDPPYGISIVNSSGQVSTGLSPGLALRGTVGASKRFGKFGTIDRGMKAKPIIKANTYAEIIGDETTQTAIAAFKLCVELKIRTMIFWGGNYYASSLPDSSCWIVWDKNNGESFFADAELAWTNHKTAVRIFKHTWNGLIKESERGEKRVHPTQKPVALAEWCFENYGKKRDTVLDLFLGSGSTLIACEQSGRKCFGMELSPEYCDVVIRRWMQFTEKEAINAKTKKKFPT